ncbi:transcription factor Opi1-domain-containing protein [Cubamyces lactineus]|nr:transcription factor Opi1-domain-containing protein [Cubamyces lactineus]
MALADQDESVRIAVRALGDMRNSTHTSSPSTSFQPTPALSITSGTSSPSLPSPSLIDEDLREEQLQGGSEGAIRRRLDPIPSSSSSSSNVAQGEGPGSEEWKSLSRVSNIPLVNSALRAYEQSKASSRVVKYGAEMMESSVKSISRPVIDRLPVGQLDDFACRQLDRGKVIWECCECASRWRRGVPSAVPRRGHGLGGLDDEELNGLRWGCRQLDSHTQSPIAISPWSTKLGSYARRTSSTSRSRNESPDPRRPWESRDVSMTRSDSDMSQQQQQTREDDDDTRGVREGTSSTSNSNINGLHQMQSRTPTPHSSAGSSAQQPPEKPTLPPASTLTQHADAQESQQVAQRSRWQAMILEAGGISAALSDESMRRLKYCLQWLQYATAQIDAQILVLRNFIASHQPDGAAPVSQQHMRTLQAAKRDVVDTIRQVVEVVSRYAGGALPEPARSRVRSFILCLPRRWAAASATGPGVDSLDHEPRGESATATGTTTGTSTSARGRHRATAPYSYGPGEPGPSPRSRPASRATSPTRGPNRGHARQTSGSAAGGPAAVAAPTADTANKAAQKILTLATESLDMLRSVTGVFKESLERADIWVERLRVVGLQRQGQNGANGAEVPMPVDPEHDPMLDFREGTHLPPLRSHTHSPVTPLSPSPYPLTPGAGAPGTAPSSGYATPYFSLPRSSSTGSVSSLNLNLNVPPAFPGPLHLGPHSASSNSSHGHAQGYGNGHGYGSYDAPSPAGAVGASFDKLSLASATSSRFATPKSVLLGLPPEGDAGGGGGEGGGGGGVGHSRVRGEKRRSESEGDENDPAVVAATALAGLAGSGGTASSSPGGGGSPMSLKRVKQEQREVEMDVDG